MCEKMNVTEERCGEEEGEEGPGDSIYRDRQIAESRIKKKDKGRRKRQRMRQADE